MRQANSPNRKRSDRAHQHESDFGARTEHHSSFKRRYRADESSRLKDGGHAAQASQHFRQKNEGNRYEEKRRLYERSRSRRRSRSPAGLGRHDHARDHPGRHHDHDRYDERRLESTRKGRNEEATLDNQQRRRRTDGKSSYRDDGEGRRVDDERRGRTRDRGQRERSPGRNRDLNRCQDDHPKKKRRGRGGRKERRRKQKLRERQRQAALRARRSKKSLERELLDSNSHLSAFVRGRDGHRDTRQERNDGAHVDSTNTWRRRHQHHSFAAKHEESRSSVHDYPRRNQRYEE